MSDGTYRGRWMDEVFRTPLVTDSTRVLLLALAREMDEEGRVSVPRNDLAELLGRNPRKIDERLKNAVDAGFLQRVSRGQKHRHAVYEATLSAPDGGRAEKPVSSTHGGRAEAGSVESQRAGFKRPEKSLSAPDGGRTEENVSATHGGRTETAAPYKDHARAHSKRPPQPPTTTDTPDSGERTGGTVVRLFDEKNNTGKTHTPARTRGTDPLVEDQAFAAFWATYPRRVAKAAARKAFAKALKNGADPAEIILGARRYNSDPRRSTADIRYTAHPATWLNQERWTDEADPAPAVHVPAPLDRRQQTTNDLFDRAMERARARDAQEGRR